MRPEIEEEAIFVAERGGMPAIVGAAFIKHGANALALKPVDRAETRHARTDDNDIGHVNELSAD
jgi:hypothetical protein